MSDLETSSSDASSSLVRDENASLVSASNSSSVVTLENASLVFTGLFLVLLILVSIVGNTLVCVAVVTEHHLRKLSNLFLVSLAIADLLVAAFVMPLALLNDLTSWQFGEPFCKFWISSDVMCSTASIINLCAISLDRYIHIKDPLQYTEWITRRSVPISIAVIWITSVLISFLPISLDLHTPSSPASASPSPASHHPQSQVDAAAAAAVSDRAVRVQRALNIIQSSHPSSSSSSHMELLVRPSSELGTASSLLEASHGAVDAATDTTNNGSSNNSCNLDFSPTYSILSSLISFFLPTIIMLFIYFHVYSFARYHMRTMKEHSKPLLRLRMEQLQLQAAAANAAPVSGGAPGTASTAVAGNAASSPGAAVTAASASTATTANPNLSPRNVSTSSNGTAATVTTLMASSGVSTSLVPPPAPPPPPSASSCEPPLLQEHKAAITIGIIMGIFLVCWAPFFCVNIISGLCKNCVSPTVFKVLTWLGYSNSVFNPIIYSIFNVEFREAFHKILTQRIFRSWLCRWCQKDRGATYL